MRNGADRTNRGNRSRRQKNLRPARCHLHRRKHRTDLRFHHEQENGRRNRRVSPRRKNRLRRLHAERRRLRPARRIDGGNCAAHGQKSRRAGHRHGSAARLLCRPLKRSNRIHRSSARTWRGGSPRPQHRTVRVDVLSRRTYKVGRRRPSARRKTNRLRPSAGKIQAGNCITRRRCTGNR